MESKRDDLVASMRRTRASARELLDGLEEAIAEDIAAAKPGRERAYVQRLAEQTRKIARSLERELEISAVSEASKRRRDVKGR